MIGKNDKKHIERKKILKLYKIIEWNVIIEKKHTKGKGFKFLEIVKKILIKAIK